MSNLISDCNIAHPKPSIEQKVQEKQDEKSDKQVSTKTKVVLGTSLAALAAIGIYVVSKGRAQKAKAEAERLANEAAQKAKAEAERLANEARLRAQKEADGKIHLQKIKRTMSEPTQISPEIIDERLGISTKNSANVWAKEDMKAYYESGCIETSERFGKKITKYPVSLKGVEREIVEKDNVITETIYYPKTKTRQVETKVDGKLIRCEVTDEINRTQTVTNFSEDAKVVTKHAVENGWHEIDDSYYSIKVYQPSKNGKMKCISRESCNYNDKGYYTKSVKQLENGYSQTEITTRDGVETIIRDNKGNIISKNEIKSSRGGKIVSDDTNFPKDAPKPPAELKELESWYKDYLSLCKKYGHAPRNACRAEHYYELCMLRDNPRMYESYMEIQAKSRAHKNPKAMISVILRDREIPGMRWLDERPKLEGLKKLNSNELETLIKAVKKGEYKGLDDFIGDYYGEQQFSIGNVEHILEILLSKYSIPEIKNLLKTGEINKALESSLKKESQRLRLLAREYEKIEEELEEEIEECVERALEYA